MSKKEKLKVLRRQRSALQDWIASIDAEIARVQERAFNNAFIGKVDELINKEMPEAKPTKTDNLDFSKKEYHGKIIDRVAGALYGRKKYAIHYKELAVRLELDPDQVAVALFTLKERGEVVRVRRGYYRGA